jgi:2-polyprenyl-3-methyl-5-hydroxy-6-metoxy-1,4-benzoquinol methylase
MEIFVAPGRDEMAKFEGVINAFPDVWEGLLLDVGCRKGNLKRALNGKKVRYVGLDLHGGADLIGDLERKMPFGNEVFNTVVALDVLEHTDNIYGALNELCRIAKKYVVVSLPNAYDITSRLRYMFGKKPSGKYGLPLQPPDDRHKWLFSLIDARVFTSEVVSRCGFQLKAEGSFVGPRRFSLIGKTFMSYFPNLFAPSYLALLQRRISV